MLCYVQLKCEIFILLYTNACEIESHMEQHQTKLIAIFFLSLNNMFTVDTRVPWCLPACFQSENF